MIYCTKSRLLHGILYGVCTLCLWACSMDPDVKRFKQLGKDICACENHACALERHQQFLDATHRVRQRILYWESAKAKRIKKPIEKAAREYWHCMNRLNPLPAVNQQCAAASHTHNDPTACRACCESHGRLYLSRADRNDKTTCLCR